jgi:hypothetical protein
MYWTPSIVIGLTLVLVIGEYDFPFIKIALDGGKGFLTVLKIFL